MKKYAYTYQTSVTFGTDVQQHFFKLRCIPVDMPTQRILKKSFVLFPQSNVGFGTDSFGNEVQYGSVNEPHHFFSFDSRGEVLLDEYRQKADEAEYFYKVETPLTIADEAMCDFSFSPTADVLTGVQALSENLYAALVYSPGVTDVCTAAAVAFAQRAGVCQDYAHIFIAICRHHGIAARYVSGLMQGTGVTHAWVEVFAKNAWYGIDPTNNRMVESGYIKLAHGRDANDCPVNRGIYTGVTSQKNDIQVVVEEL